MSGNALYSNINFSNAGNSILQDGNSSVNSERSQPAAWESAVNSRGELFYAEPEPAAEVTRPRGGGAGAGEPGPPPSAAAATPAPPPPPTSATGKLRQLLRRRRSQKTPGAELGVVQEQRSAGEGDDPNVEVYRAVVRLDALSVPSAGQPEPPAESLLGLIAEHQVADGGAGSDQLVTVAALAPRGPLVRNTRVRIGDTLVRVNGSPVTAATLPATLLSLPRRSKVSLTFRRGPRVDGAGSTNGIVTPASCDGIVTSLTGDGLRLEELGRLLRDVPYGLFCLSTDGVTESSPERQDIVYQFPGYDTALLSARGSLLTLSGLTQQISGDTPVRARILVGGALVHVAVTCRDDLVVLLAVPGSSLSAEELHQLGRDLWQLLCLEFGSIRSAFCDASHRPYVDHLVGLVMQRSLLTPRLTAGRPGALPLRLAGSLDTLLGQAHAIHLPRHVQVLIDDSLTELESGDFGEESEDFYGLQRLYLLRGSALYYKGYLVASHLPWEEQAGVHVFLRHHQLLERSRRDGWRQVVVWRRYHRPPSGADTDTDTAAHPDAYPSDTFTYYLLVVGTGHALLAVILESGGCTADLGGTAGPDSIYVEEAQATLFQLESMGVMDMCESWLGGSSTQGSSADDGAPAGATLFQGSARDVLLDKRRWSSLARPKGSGSRLPKAGDIGAGRNDGASGEQRRPIWRVDTSDCVEGDASAELRDSNSPSADGSSSTDDSDTDTWEIYRGPPKSRLLPDQYDLMENKKIYIGQALEDCRRIVSDTMSLVVQFVLLDERAATYLALPEAAPASAVSGRLLAGFSQAVGRLRLLLQPPPATEASVSSSADVASPHEAGTLFSLDESDEAPTFWVVGRQVSAARQLFVCVPGCTPPNMLELAFALSHGTGPH